jgi:hypothetical protein
VRVHGIRDVCGMHREAGTDDDHNEEGGKMQYTKRSQLTGATHTMEIAATEEQISNWEQGMVIQRAMPNIPPEQREFLMTGITPQEWDMYVGPEPDDEG